MFVIIMLGLIILAYFFSKFIHKNEIYFYSLALILAIVATFLYENPSFEFINLGFLGVSFMLVVMITGAFSRKSTLSKRLRTVRKEYSIIGFILIIPHGLIYLYYSLIGSIAYEWYGIISFVIMIPLFIISFKIIKKRMNIKSWVKYQKFAYFSYLLLFIHLLITTSEFTVQYLVIFGLYFLVKQINYIYKSHAIIKSIVLTSVIVILIVEFAGLPVFSTAESEIPVISSTDFVDGTYRAQAVGYNQLIVDLEVTIVDGEIMDIHVYDCGCTPYDKRGLYLYDANLLINQIIQQNSAQIDIIAGATHTSEGILEAVQKALLEAAVN
ncbi:MAG: ferric reductase-like transmembrane domain-containing protein [Acholeplasmataceae bacterium]|nr:ferric reductase-like transmembrane domain-containing protein [Acholeplasmataceae bacterium]